MAVVRQAGALLLAALIMSRGLFAQDSAAVVVASPADQVKVLLRPTEIRYVQQESVLLPPTANIKALYVNAWAFGSQKLWQLVRLADETEINAFVIDVKDDTGCLLYPSAVPTAEQIGANKCVRAKDAKARLDTLAAHGIYPIARIVVAKDPLLAERKGAWSVKDRDTGGLWRDRINIAWVDAYNDSVWIYSAQRPPTLGFRMATADRAAAAGPRVAARERLLRPTRRARGPASVPARSRANRNRGFGRPSRARPVEPASRSPKAADRILRRSETTPRARRSGGSPGPPSCKPS